MQWVELSPRKTRSHRFLLCSLDLALHPQQALYSRACMVSSVGAGWGLSTSLSEHPHSVWLRVSPLLLSPFHQDHIIQAPIHDSPALTELTFLGEDTTQNLIKPVEKLIAGCNRANKQEEPAGNVWGSCFRDGSIRAHWRLGTVSWVGCGGLPRYWGLPLCWEVRSRLPTCVLPQVY